MPTALQNNDLITSLSPVGYDGSGGWQTGAHIRFIATENWNSTSIGSAISLRTPSNGTNTVQERLRIDHNGNVGIGTATPTDHLEVVGSGDQYLKIQSTSTTNAGAYTRYIRSTTGTAREWWAGTGVNSNGNFDIYDRTASADRLTIDTNGNVGIGTTNPIRSFHNGRNEIIITENQSGVADWRKWRFYSLADTGNSNREAIAMGILNDAGTASSIDALLIRPNGNVGIGNVAPMYKLDVAGSGNFSTSAGGIELSLGNSTMTTSNKRIRLVQDAGGTITRISNNGDTINYMSFQMDSGNVGIGTTGPGSKLDVQGGSVNASGGYTQTSDIRLKTNIDYLKSEEALNKILNLRGILYDWKDQAKYGSSRQVGLIAQDVQKVFPEAVKETPSGYLTVSYSNLVAPVIEAIKELNKRVSEALKTSESQSRSIASLQEAKAERSEVEKLKAENELKDKKIKELEQRLERIEKSLYIK